MKNASVKLQLAVYAGMVSLLMLLLGVAAQLNMQSLKKDLLAAQDARADETRALMTATSLRAGVRQGVNVFKTILLRGGDSADYSRFVADFNKADADVRTLFKDLSAQLPGIGLGAQQAELDRLLKLHIDTQARLQSVLKTNDQAIRNGRSEIAYGQTDGVGDSTVAAVSKFVVAVRKHSTARAEADAARAERLFYSSMILLAVIALAGMLLVALAAWLFQRNLLRQLGGEPVYAANIARAIANGDLNVSVAVRPDSPDSLLASIVNMQSCLRQVIVSVVASTRQMTEAASAMSSTTGQIAAASESQNEAAGNMAASVQQLTVSIGQVSESSAQALRISRHAGERSGEGNGMVQASVDDMKGIATGAEEFTRVIRELGNRSAQISTIVTVIEEIAGQTNLLALNAAIEAARAGEQGRGFSVVADEVRKLAERTASSTREIAAMVTAIQEGTGEAVNYVEVWGAKVEQGMGTASAAGECMNSVKEGADQVVGVVNEITTALTEQSSASVQLARNVDRIASMTEQNRAAVSSLAGEARSLEQMAQTLAGLISHFRLGTVAAGNAEVW